ncbi:MAG: GGDEF domain-containing protein [Gammaproteobacteria bacterium]|nr:GGDEF domain-containing protein [Gammaproteobacteria bacterium]
MIDPDEDNRNCPACEEICPWHDEVLALRQKVEELSELVSTDALTGLYNFRHFKNVLQAEMDRSKRSGIPTSLVLLDIDHFKQVNDTHGHEIGNQALCHLAEILRGEVRTTDIVCRYGGEEFALVFPETHLNLAVKVADRIRLEIQDTPAQTDAGELRMTVSMGASVYMKTSAQDIDEFVDSVDKFLYEAKQSGRNCICHVDYQTLRSATEIGADERALLMSTRAES